MSHSSNSMNTILVEYIISIRPSVGSQHVCGVAKFCVAVPGVSVWTVEGK